MKYTALPFEQYFIDASGDWNNTGKATFNIIYNVVKYIHNKKTYNAYYKVHYDRARNVIQCFFKETTDNTGWRANFDFAEKYYDEFDYDGNIIKLKVHCGWSAMYKAMKHHIREDYSYYKEKYPTAETEIIGWSLGSGQAQLCAQDLFYNFGVKAYIYTFGSVQPFFGYNKDMRNYLKNIYKACYNFADVNDIVTYMPPFVGYFMLNKVKVRLKRFCIFRLFDPNYYHACYYLKKLYFNIN